jgi:hypothetical protein
MGLWQVTMIGKDFHWNGKIESTEPLVVQIQPKNSESLDCLSYLQF